MVIEELLEELVKRGGSDLHISNALPPVMRVDGQLLRYESTPLTPDDVEALLFPHPTNAKSNATQREKEINLTVIFIVLPPIILNFFYSNADKAHK